MSDASIELVTAPFRGVSFQQSSPNSPTLASISKNDSEGRCCSGDKAAKKHSCVLATLQRYCMFCCKSVLETLPVTGEDVTSCFGSISCVLYSA